ncbi:MAG TPA: dUTP diphosphatase [Candidatus Paceibacterota bacterium]|nr:dUTP diphosphatase [Candidatus Paceibacterota bacterium]
MSKQIKLKRFDKSLPLPAYKTKGAAGFDLAARETVTITPATAAMVPLNVAITIPKDHFVILAARSSLHKLGLLPINGVGIVDSDYAGEEDEYKFLAYNFTKKPVTIEKGTRIAQGIFVKFTRATWKEVSKMTAKTRGGFGSTGDR